MLLKKKKDIIAWLDKYKIESYTLRPDENYGYVVDVNGYVDLGGQGLKHIPVKFAMVSGSFYCNFNLLTSLQGSPHIVGREFFCDDNQLISLEGGPDRVDGNFQCHTNQLTSLEGSPQSVGGDFDCRNNELTSLEGMPEVVEGRFFCRGNPHLGELQDITNLKAIKTYLIASRLAEKLPHDLNHSKKVKL